MNDEREIDCNSPRFTMINVAHQEIHSKVVISIIIKETYLGWHDGIGLGPGSVLFLEVLDSILSIINLGGLV